MNKHFKFFLTSAAIAAALVGAVSCQKDYSGDIDDLNSQISALKTQLTDLQNKINSGEVVTNVEKTAGGITVTTTKGKYDIVNGTNGTNGTNGKDGKDGKDGSVVTIGENGNWFIDGKDTGLAAAGKDGTNGTNGTNGKDGQNGEYYVPNPETGCFDKYAYDATKGEYVKTATEISYIAPGAITAVYDPEAGTLTLFGVEGLEDGYVITLDSELKSLVFVPQAYVEGVEAMLIETLSYNALTIQNKDKKDGTEKAVKAEKESAISPTIVAQYYVNPANAKLDSLTFDFVTEPNLDYIQTRTDASDDLKIEVAGWEEGKHQGRRVVNVTLKVTGTPAIIDEESSKISVVALEAKTPDGQLVLSDYATLYSNAIDQIRIADPIVEAKKKGIVDGEEHYRRATEGINVPDAEAYLSEKAAWEDATTLPESKAICDTVVLYNGSIDLAGVVAAHAVGAEKCAELNAERLAALGLEWNIELVKNYQIGTPVTDQADFVTLDGTVFTPKVFDLESSEAAIGRTPIFRVNLVNPAIKDKDGKPEIVECAYVKVFIGAPEDVIPDATFPIELGTVSFACVDTTLSITVKQMNEEVYTPMHTSHDNFRATYTADAEKAEGVGTVVENTDKEQTQATVVWTWTISANELWDNMGEDISIKIPYTHNVNGRVVTLELKAKVADDFKTAFDVTTAKYYPIYWFKGLGENRAVGYDYAEFNVQVPTNTEDDDPENCQFINNLNGIFKVNAAGVIDVDKAVTAVEYFFYKDLAGKKKVGNIEVTYTIEADGLELWGEATGYEKQLIAKITNSDAADAEGQASAAESDYVNKIELQKDSDLAKALLNEDRTSLFVWIGAKGKVCGDDGKPVTISFNGKPYFEARYVRPLTFNDQAADNFIDGVNYGQVGSYILIEKVLDPIEWRDYGVTKIDTDKPIAERKYPFVVDSYLWDYYGEFKVSVDEEDIDIEYADGTVMAKHPDMKIQQMTRDELLNLIKDEKLKEQVPEAKYDFLTYFNNGQVTNQDFYLRVNVTVEYGWGKVVLEDVKVLVKSTIGQDE